MDYSNPKVSDPNDYKVVTFHNKESFDFTPEMGCMFDGRPVNGRSGAPGIQAGESVQMMYHMGWRLAMNLAKRVFNTSPAATVDFQGIPTGVVVWNPDKLKELASTYITEMYSEEKPVAKSESEIMLAKFEELKKMVEGMNPKPSEEKPTEAPQTPANPPSPQVYQDKQEVIAELEKRGIKFDRRQNKANLEKLLI